MTQEPCLHRWCHRSAAPGRVPATYRTPHVGNFRVEYVDWLPSRPSRPILVIRVQAGTEVVMEAKAHGGLSMSMCKRRRGHHVFCRIRHTGRLDQLPLPGRHASMIEEGWEYGGPRTRSASP